MKLLEKEFTQNADKRGNNKFVQVKRNDTAAIYRRYAMDGRPLEFEVFTIRQAGGCEIFGKHYDRYEAYPGAAAFGKTAWSTPFEDRANEIFEMLTKGDKPGQSTEPSVVRVKNVGGKRGRKRVVRLAVVLPKKKFCMKELLSLNTTWSHPTLYFELRRMIKAKKVVEADRVSMGRGRPTVFYKAK